VIQRWIVSLTDAPGETERLIPILEKMTKTIDAVARQKLRKKDPASFCTLPETAGLDEAH
jgi:hypothetical protein